MLQKAQIIFLTISSFLPSGMCSSCTDPCVGGSGCANGGPQSFAAAVDGPGSFSYSWSDPSDITSVDLYQIDLTVDDNGLACAGSASGATCSLTIPAQGIISGNCDTSTAGTNFCWISGYLGSLIAFPWAQPCDRSTDPTCNSGEYAGFPGVHYYLRAAAGRCCYYGALQTPGCSSCPGINTGSCPMSTYATADIVAMGK